MDEIATGVPKIPLNKAKELVKTLYKMGNRQSIIWLGAPGIGKSEGIKQVAMELAEDEGKEFVEIEFSYEKGKIDFRAVYQKAIEILKDPDSYFTFLDIRLTEYEPVDLLGAPREFEIDPELFNIESIDGKTKLFDYVPFIWQLIASATAGISLFDEITNVKRDDMRSVMFKIFRDRKTGWIKFHDDNLIMGAGNTPEDSAIAGMLDAPVINRVRVFKILPPSVDEWAEYMNKYVEDWDSRVYAFLKKFPQFFFQKPDDVETLEPFPTPRAWTELAKVSHYFDDETLEYIAYSNVGSEACSHFITYVRTDVPDVEEVLKNPNALAMLEIDGKYLVASQISMQIRKDFSEKKPNLGKYVRLLSWLYQNDRELLVLIATMVGGKAMRKLHAMCMTNSVTRPIAQYLTEAIKMTWEAGV